jgi:hypothetical protein
VRLFYLIENMERETRTRDKSSLGSGYANENKDQKRSRLCTLTTANHREINAYPEKPENGVNGVKSRTSLLTPFRYHPDSPLDRLTALFSTAPKAIHVTSKCNYQTST